MDNYRPTKVNRYWKRPKLRVYDCNVRDAERFYQDSYKRYLSDKEDAARRAARSRSVDLNRATTEFYPHLLAGSFKREERDNVSRQLEMPPLPTPLAEVVKNRWDPDYKVVPETSFTAKQEGLADFDPRDTASIEERYQKLRKLREELNLPAEGAETSALAKMRGGSVSGGGGGYGTEESFRSEQSSRTLASAGGPDESSSYSFRSERTARMNGNAGGGPEGYKFKTESTSEYRRGGNGNSYDYKLRSERGGDQNSSDYRLRSERGGAAGEQNSYDYKLRSERGGDQNSLDYKLRSERGGAGEQNSYDYKLRSERGGGDQNAYEYKYKSERGTDQNSFEYKPRSERAAASDLTSTDYKYRSERGAESSDYKSKYDLKSDDFKLPSKAVDFDLPKTDRKKDDYSFSPSSDRKTERYSSLSSSAAASSATTEKKSLSSSSKDADKELDDDNVSDMMKKLPSSQEILERISKLELDD